MCLPAVQHSFASVHFEGDLLSFNQTELTDRFQRHGNSELPTISLLLSYANFILKTDVGIPIHLHGFARVADINPVPSQAICSLPNSVKNL